MKFTIFSGYKKEDSSKLEKILTCLYGPSEFKLVSGKSSTLKSSDYKGSKLFNVSGSSLRSSKVIEVDLKASPDTIVYSIITSVGMGVAETVVAEAIELAK